jgi:hypothetical protein
MKMKNVAALSAVVLLAVTGSVRAADETSARPPAAPAGGTPTTSPGEIEGVTLGGGNNVGAIDNAGNGDATHAGTPATGGAVAHENPGEPLECRFKEPSLKINNGVGEHSLDYFISAADKQIYYIANGQNWLRDQRGTESHPIPGSIDPVPTPDGKWLTIPGMRFYDMRAIEARHAAGQDASDVPPTIDDFGLSGVYQSIGQLPDQNGGNVYRVITDQGGATFQDYEAHQGPNVESAVVKPIHAAGGQRLCPELETQNMQMPMLSKDGRYISLYSSDDRATKIYEITDGTWACREVLNLGFPTGKVDFNFDNSEITFHQDAYYLHTGYFSGVDSMMTKDIYTVQLTKDSNGKVNGAKSISRLSFSGRKGSGTYYPRYNKQGEIMAARDQENNFSIATFDASKAYTMPFWTPTGSVPTPTRDAVSRYALGALWNKACAKEGYAFDTATEATFAALSLDPRACRELATKYWEQKKEEVKTELRGLPNMQVSMIDELTLDSITAACPDINHPDGQVENIGILTQGELNIQRIFNGRCQECHFTGARVEYPDGTMSPAAPYINFRQPLTMDHIKMSQRMIGLSTHSRYRMPPQGSGQLDDEEITLLREHLAEKERELLQGN